MVFRLECKDVSTGLQLGSFTFSKIIYEQEIPSRWVHNITIDPTDKVVFFTEEEYHREGNFTGIAEWPSVDLAQIKISAEDAIRIAENAGGTKIRDAAGNNCNIFETFDIAGTSHQNDWVISYSANDEHMTTLLKVFIDGFTGGYEVVH